MQTLVIGLRADWPAYEQMLEALLGVVEPIPVAERLVWERLADGSLDPAHAARTHGHVLLGQLMRHGMISGPEPDTQGVYHLGEEWDRELAAAYAAYARGEDDPLLMRLSELWACAWSAEAWLVALSAASHYPPGHREHRRHRQWQREAWECYEAARRALDPDVVERGPSVCSAVEVWYVCSTLAEQIDSAHPHSSTRELLGEREA